MNILEAIEKLDTKEAINSLTILTSLEREIIEQLRKVNHSITTQELVNGIIEDLFKCFDNTVRRLEDIGQIKIIPHHFADDTVTQFYSAKPTKKGDFEVVLFGEMYYPGHSINSNYSTVVSAWSLHMMNMATIESQSARTERKRTTLTQFIKIPGFRRVGNILLEMEALGMVISRKPIEKRRAKKLYTLNPKLREILKGEKSIEEKLTSLRSSTESKPE